MTDLYAPGAKTITTTVNTWPRGHEAISLGFCFGLGLFGAAGLMTAIVSLTMMALAA